MNYKHLSISKKLFFVLVNVISLNSFCVAQESDNAYTETLLLKLVKEKHVKSVKEIEDKDSTEKVLKARWFNESGLETITQISNYETQVNYYNNGKITKQISYSTVNLADTSSAKHIIYKLYNSLGQIINRKYFIDRKLENSKSTNYCINDTCYFTENFYENEKIISGTRTVQSKKLKITNEIRYNKNNLIKEITSYYSKYDELGQPIEDGDLLYDDGIKEFIDNYPGNKNTKAYFVFMNQDSLNKMILSGIIKPTFFPKVIYSYVENKLVSVNDELNYFKMQIVYDNFGLPKEVSQKHLDEELNTKTLYLYDENNLPKEVQVYNSQNKIISKRLFKYTF